MKHCPPGMFRNTNMTCKCKPGLVEKGGKCVKIAIPKCYHGKIRKNGKCVCPPGSVKNRKNECVCVRGYEMVNHKCVKSSPNSIVNPLYNAKNQSFSAGLNSIISLDSKSLSPFKIIKGLQLNDGKHSTPLKTPTPLKTTKGLSLNNNNGSRRTIKLTRIKKKETPLDIIKQECPKSLDCLLLNSKHRNKIKELFDDFKTFNTLKTVTPKNTKSQNASVLVLDYNYHEYETSALLKIQKTTQTDSLVYEYLTGLEINHYLPYLPNFLETYGLFEARKPHVITQYKNIDIFKGNFKYNNMSDDEMLIQAVKDPTKNALLLEYVHNSCMLEEKLKDRDFINNELIFVLFQIYYALFQLRDKFAHYDLHSANVLLYSPYKDEYIRFRYHIDGKTYSFYSKYIVKLIDYGSSYTEQSLKIYNKLCKIDNIPRRCGRDAGFSVSNKARIDACLLDYKKQNQSSDLRLLYQLKRKIAIPDLLNKLFNLPVKTSSQEIECRIPSLASDKKTMNNITDVYRYLCMLITTTQQNGLKKRAEITIHGLKEPYEFIETDEESNVEPIYSNSNSGTESENVNENRWNM
jgi:hypothetical protein